MEECYLDPSRKFVREIDGLGCMKRAPLARLVVIDSGFLCFSYQVEYGLRYRDMIRAQG